jgi:hypothetical protein
MNILSSSCRGWISNVCSSLRSLITSRLGICGTRHYRPDVFLSYNPVFNAPIRGSLRL